MTWFPPEIDTSTSLHELEFVDISGFELTEQRFERFRVE
jgi:hypothetical protein